VKLLTTLCLALIGLLLATPVLAQTGDSGAVVALHAQAHDTKGIGCSGLDPDLACRDFTTTWPVHSSADVYMVVARADSALGISALSCGISYSNPVSLADGVGCDVFGYLSCADLEYTNSPDGDSAHDFPWSGGGNRFIWVRTTNCQQTERGADGVHAVAAVFYVYAYSPDEFEVIQNENLQFGPELLVSDCAGPANSNLAYPSHAGKIGFGAPGINPCAGEVDLTPPVLLSAWGSAYSTHVQLTFSEDVVGGATDVSNYTVHETTNPTYPITVTSASVSGSQVGLTLSSPLQGSTEYVVSVTGVSDAAGNLVAPGSTAGFTTSSGDVTPPELVSASGAYGDNHVVLTFSENVVGGATTVSNYSVHPTAYPGAYITVIGAARSQTVVTLTLAANLAPGTTYTVTVANVSDASGNVIAPGSSVQFTTTATNDVTPPSLILAYGDAGYNHVTVRFDEDVSQGADVPSNYGVTSDDDPASPLTVNAASASGSTVILTLASNLVGPARYTVEVTGVEDLAGNAIVPGSTIDFTTAAPDTAPPELTSAAGTAGDNQVTLTFSEPVPIGSTTVSNYSVYPSADPSSPLAVVSASRSYNVVTLTLASDLAAGTTYTAEVSNLGDLAGNLIAPNSTAEFTTDPGDVTPPGLLSASGTAGGDLVTLGFSEAVAGGADVASNYSVYPTADPSSPLAVSEASAAGAQVILTLASALAPETAYTVAVTGVEDEAGNTIEPGATASFTTGAADLTPPTLVGALGLTGNNLVTVTFSEPVVVGAATVSNYAVYPSGDPSQPYTVNSAVPSGAHVDLYLTSSLLASTSYTVTVSGVADAAGNLIASNSSVSFTTAAGGGNWGPQSQSMVALHAQAHDAKGLSCGSMDAGAPCYGFTYRWPVGTPADVFMVITNANADYGVSGVSLGVRYSNVGTLADGVGCDVLGYVSCADLEYTNSPDGIAEHEFPYSGGGNRLIWVRTTNCQRTEVVPYGVQTVACAFYVYAYGPDQFIVDMNRNLQFGPEFQIVDCEGPALSDMPWPSHAGVVGFGMDGYNPCLESSPTVRTTWGRLKNQYR
jgi:hypothetical protein